MHLISSVFHIGIQYVSFIHFTFDRFAYAFGSLVAWQRAYEGFKRTSGPDQYLLDKRLPVVFFLLISFQVLWSLPSRQVLAYFAWKYHNLHLFCVFSRYCMYWGGESVGVNFLQRLLFLFIGEQGELSVRLVCLKTYTLPKPDFQLFMCFFLRPPFKDDKPQLSYSLFFTLT